MAQMIGADDIESLRIELAEIGRSLRSSFQRRNYSSFRSISSAKDDGGGGGHDDDDIAEAQRLALQWTSIEKLPTFERLRSSLFEKELGDINGGLNDDDDGDDDGEVKRVPVDVAKLGAQERQRFIGKLIKHIESDNLRLLRKIRTRIDKVGVKLPTIEVRYKDLRLEAECEVVHGKPLPTLWNSFKSKISEFAKMPGLGSGKAKISIFNDVSGVIKSGRLTLLLGPPGCGKTSLLKALSGNLDSSLKLTGEVSYNGYKLEKFVPQKTAAYISQFDQHIPDMTVRETLDFSARCQGVGSRAEIMMEVSRREKEAGIVPDPDIDTYMKAIAVKGLKRTLQTDYILKILGLDICADTWVGDAMRRGISGGQKKRLTTGEMIVGPTKALFMDEITNGLDSSTAFQIVACLQQLVHITDCTVLVSLLQPAPEAFELFDDLILMSEGKIVYHGPRDHVLEFFEDCGFKCPERKGVADFVQEASIIMLMVISKKDQAQYWYPTEQAFRYVSVDEFSNKFKASLFGKKLDEELSQPYDKSQGHENALSFSVYSLSKWELLRACTSRELLLMKRNSFIYIFKTTQLTITAFITMTVFLRTRMEVDVLHSNYYMGALFYALTMLLVIGVPEMSMTILRLEIFYKQKELRFYPAWAYAIPASLLKIPLSLLESLVWTCLTYYVIGYSPEVHRFFRQFFLLFLVHASSLSMFRFMASLFQTMVATMTAGSFAMLFVLLFAGFIITKPSMPVWLKWGFWVSPLSYGEMGLSVNEFLAPRWQKILSTNTTTIGQETLQSRGLNFDGYIYWISVGALFGFTILFNIGFILALNFLKSPGSSSGAIISKEKLSQLRRTESSHNGAHEKEKSKVQIPNTNIQTDKGKMVLPFTPLTVVFQDLQYFVDTPLEMREQGFTQNKLQLLADITGSFRPGVLTALMGVSGAGKTTLLDVLAGRKTTGYIEGEIKIGGYPKVQETFARISGYCEQTDIHSPQITVEESVIFSAWLRLDSSIDSKTKSEFVSEVLETIELDGIKDALVGIHGVSGLSNEQRKRLTIAVELVSNPSVIFMDEPTTGLDARSAAIVMRAVKNIADTGRTIVCTVHQPSIDLFESFDELILLKTGGRIIYSGPLGKHSSRVIEYFEGIPGVANIRNNYNPATWMLEVTSTSAEAELGVDFAQIFRESALYENNKDLAKQLSTPPPGSRDLHFPTRFSQNAWGQFKSCLWKQNLSYWRSPSYNLMRIIHTLVSAFLFGALFWNQGKKITNQQNLFNIFGSMFTSVIFLGINNCTTVLQHVATERTVMYREKFAGMYSSWAYSISQVAVEIPYLFTEAILFLIITYPMIGYYGTPYKIFWYFYGFFCTFLYFNYLGMMLVSLTPNFNVAAILASVFYTLFNLFAGFLIPKRHIPKWWIWLYYLIPTSWSLNGLLTSQYGDIDKEIEIYGEFKSVANFIKDYFGFRHDQLPLVAVVVIAFPLAYASLFAYCIGRLNFQRR
ncbi:ABC transporter-like [Parasponia andersonii]|uniref:ABC transporter-like n=1 Tax=Parasponia andersonii TaxID=3476 RepID=A0A2P5D8J7_PARAD|nr:ABC transporter-like [Parasponia andersonii]